MIATRVAGMDARFTVTGHTGPISPAVRCPMHALLGGGSDHLLRREPGVPDDRPVAIPIVGIERRGLRALELGIDGTVGAGECPAAIRKTIDVDRQALASHDTGPLPRPLPIYDGEGSLIQPWLPRTPLSIVDGEGPGEGYTRP